MMSSEQPPQPHSLEFSVRGGSQPKKRCRIIDEGMGDDNMLIGTGSSGIKVAWRGNSGEFDLNVDDGGHDWNDDGDHGGNLGKLHGFDLNEGVNFVLHEGLDLNRGIVEESSGAKREMFDLNLDINQESENVNGEGKGIYFDLNLKLTEDDSNLNDCDWKLRANGRARTEGGKQMREALPIGDYENLANADGEKGITILDGKKDQSQLSNYATGVAYGKVEPVSELRKIVGRRGKELLVHQLESKAPEAFVEYVETGNLNLKLVNKEETPFKKATDSVDYDHGVSGSAQRGRRGRKRRESLDENGKMGLRRRHCRLSGRDCTLNAGGINNQLSSLAVSTVSDEMINMSGHEKYQEPILPSKVELPPSSGSLDLDGVSMSDFVSVYAFLRSFSTLLFLSPFELDDFARCMKCTDSTSLFDSIHVSILKTLWIHLESLSDEGYTSASNCLRSFNWDFLDLITWPVFVVGYLLLHSPRYIPGLDIRHFEPFQLNYYEMPVSAKVEILRHLCDDVIETKAFRLELNRRTLESKGLAKSDRGMKSDSSRRKEALMGIASNSTITEENAGEPADWNGDECCLCKMDGNLICCDGCPAAFHSRCVGVNSSLLPEGDWYCPECVIDKDNPSIKMGNSIQGVIDKDSPWIKMGMPIRGGELLGIDPHGRLYYSSCGCLLVLESRNDEYSSWFYKRNDILTLVEALASSPYLYDEIISAICKHWNVIHGVDRMRKDLGSQSHSIQLTFAENMVLSIRHPASSEAINKDKGIAGKRSGEKSVRTNPSFNMEFETSDHANVMVEAELDGGKMENQLASSEGSVEVSQAFTKTDILKEGGLDCSKRCPEVPHNSHIPGNLVNSRDCRITSTMLKIEQGNILRSADYGNSLTMNSKRITSEVFLGIHYINFYEFARTASSVVLQELTSKPSDKGSEDATISAEKIIAGQLKVASNRSAKFSWSNIQNTNLKSRKEKCGWCLHCKVPEDGRDCLFIMNDCTPAVENFTSEVLGIQPRKDRKNHLTDVICHMICIEHHLQGLLLGPWLNPRYSKLWREGVIGATDLASTKDLLLELELNLHHLALSAAWRKPVDSVSTMGSASHIVKISTRVTSKHGADGKRAKFSKLEISAPSKAVAGVRLFWWRGGKASRKLFNWKVLPHSLASKAGRQGGCTKILGVHYPESGECAKRIKYAAWRAAVEMSRSVEQLALQVRELDANIRWDDMGNTGLRSKMDKESNKPIRSFKKVIIRTKCHEGKVVKYLLDFGKRRFIPDIVLKHGFLLKDLSSDRKKYWLEESHVPLPLLKDFEEKRIVRNSEKVSNTELHESSKLMRKSFKKKGFPYLFSRAERSENYQCGHCNKDVLIREAVTCQFCKGFFHERHAQKSSGSVTNECTYTCPKCEDKKLLLINARKGKTVLESKKALKAAKPSCSRKGEKMRKDKQQVQSKKRRDPSVVPLRQSARNAECISKLSLQNMNELKKQKRKEQAKPKKDVLKKLNNISWHKWHKRRTPVKSSYWLNGLRLSRRRNDERLMHSRSKLLLVPSGEETFISDKPKCSLCDELEYAPELNYVACEICRVWFHGDAFHLGADKIDNIIGFKCYHCLNKRPPVCPHHC